MVDLGRRKSESWPLGDEPLFPSFDADALQHLKRVSRIKHVILQKYLLPWATILGSSSSRLVYFDCFAGPGLYEFEDRPVGGSPVIAVQAVIEFLRGRADRSLEICLVEDDPQNVVQLDAAVQSLKPFPIGLEVIVRHADSRLDAPSLLKSVGAGVPLFLNVDPYGHPLPLSAINEVLKRDRTEVFINLMWYQINRDLGNKLVHARLNQLFGDGEWQNQAFMNMQGQARQDAFLRYFRSRLRAQFVRPFKIRFDPEDRRGGGTKYYLLHASNHVKATLLMKEVMWPLGDEEGTFDYSGTSQGVLISQAPTQVELQQILLLGFNGREIGFDQLREETWELPFVEKHYRAVISSLEGKGVTVNRISSKKTGIKGLDRIRFR